MCLKKHPVISFDTGNMSSHDHLGINAQRHDRILYRRKTTCAPIMDKGFITSFNYTDVVNASLVDFSGSDGDVLDFYNFGHTYLLNGSQANNFSFAYNRRQAAVGTGYGLS